MYPRATRTETGQLTVDIVPTNSRGLFLVDADSYGERVVKEVGIKNLTEAEKEAVEAGDRAPVDACVTPDKTEEGRLNFSGRAEVSLDIPSSGNSVGGVVISSCVEFTPAALSADATHPLNEVPPLQSPVSFVDSLRVT